MKTLLALCLSIPFTTGVFAQATSDPASLLDAEFDDQPLDQPIGLGGPDVGEPVSVAPGLAAIVRAAPLPTPSLELSQSATGSARSVRFEFVGGEEVSHGDLEIRFRFEAAQLDNFIFYVREHGTSTRAFLNLNFLSTGQISVTDAAGSSGFVGTYTANVNHLVLAVFHMDEGTYDLTLDSTALLTGRAHGIADRGIGAVLPSTDSATLPSSLFYVDRLRVDRGDGIFRDGFE